MRAKQSDPETTLGDLVTLDDAMRVSDKPEHWIRAKVASGHVRSQRLNDIERFSRADIADQLAKGEAPESVIADGLRAAIGGMSEAQSQARLALETMLKNNESLFRMMAGELEASRRYSLSLEEECHKMRAAAEQSLSEETMRAIARRESDEKSEMKRKALDGLLKVGLPLLMRRLAGNKGDASAMPDSDVAVKAAIGDAVLSTLRTVPQEQLDTLCNALDPSLGDLIRGLAGKARENVSS